MNPRQCRKIADRMHTLLVSWLGQGIDSPRMLADPLYARDVLLVCDAMPGTELAQLSQLFRGAMKAEPPTAVEVPRREASGLSTFLNSMFAPSSISPPSTLDAPAAPPPRRQRGWFVRIGGGPK
jgi:hypothetical protein